MWKTTMQTIRIPMLLTLCLVTGLGCATVKAPAIKAGTPEKAALEILTRIDQATRATLTPIARIEFLKHRPHLGLDSALKSRIANMLASDSEPDSDAIDEVIRSSASLAAQRRRLELLGTTSDQQNDFYTLAASDLGKQLGVDLNRIKDPGMTEMRDQLAIKSEGLKEAMQLAFAADEVLASQELNYVSSLTSEKERRKYLEGMLDSASPSIKQRGRLARKLLSAPAMPFVYGWMAYHVATEYHGPNDVEWNQVQVYEPSHADDQKITDHLTSATLEELAQLYAPRIVQEVNPEADYAPTADEPGKVYLKENQSEENNGDAIEVCVDTEQPTIYYHFASARISGEDYRQVVYTIWYPEHPELKKNDPEAGKLDGLMIRMTLSHDNLPLCFETVYACGCYHRIFPTEKLEDAALETWGEPGENQDFALQKEVTGRIDGTIPELAGKFDLNNPHPSVWIYAGFHLIGKIATDDGKIKPSSNVVQTSLVPYDELEALPLGDRYASMFGPDGLVHGADRREAKLMFSTGIYHAGTPRQRGTHMIHFDQYDFDNPSLLSAMLRWPDPKLL